MGALGALYLVEGLLWARRQAVALSRGRGGYVRQAVGGPLGTPHEVFVPLSPLPPLPETLIVEPWPLTIASDGVWLTASQTFAEAEAPPSDVSFWTWAEAEKVRREGRAIEGPGRRSVKTSSAALAAYLVEAIHHAASLSSKKRARYLDQLMADAHDLDAIRARRDEVDARARRLKWYANLVAPALLVGAYAVFFVPAVFAYAHWVGLALLALLVAVWVETFVAHSRLYPGLTGDRWMTTLLLVVSPPAGSRAHAWVVRDGFARFHPVAVARALGTRDTWMTLAAEAWRDLRWPLGPTAADAEGALTDSRARLSAQLRRLVQADELDVDDFEAAPTPEADGLAAYCPRCHAQFKTADGTCSDCPGVERVPFSVSPRSADAA